MIDSNPPEAPNGSENSAAWKKEFYRNIDALIELGIDREKASEILSVFLRLSSDTPMPDVMRSFRAPELLEQVGVFGGVSEKTYLRVKHSKAFFSTEIYELRFWDFIGLGFIGFGHV